MIGKNFWPSTTKRPFAVVAALRTEIGAVVTDPNASALPAELTARTRNA
jgi:hypothetical protein